jgi:arsenate reductase
MAETIFNNLAKNWKAESAGIEAAKELDFVALDVIRRRGYTVKKAKPVKLEDLHLEDYHLVISVCDEASCVNIQHPNIERWHVEDPKGKPGEVYERVFDEIELKVKGLLMRIEGMVEDMIGDKIEVVEDETKRRTENEGS